MSRGNPTPAERIRLRAAQKRYEQTAKGKACLKRHRDKRIWLNRNHAIGVAKTIEDAKAINAHIQRRKREFVTRFAAGAETESLPPRAVRPETTVREDRL